MRLTLTAGGITVDLRTDPTEGVSLDEDQTFGFALSSDTERAPETEPMEADDDD